MSIAVAVALVLPGCLSGEPPGSSSHPEEIPAAPSATFFTPLDDAAQYVHVGKETWRRREAVPPVALDGLAVELSGSLARDGWVLYEIPLLQPVPDYTINYEIVWDIPRFPDNEAHFILLDPPTLTPAGGAGHVRLLQGSVVATGNQAEIGSFTWNQEAIGGTIGEAMPFDQIRFYLAADVGVEFTVKLFEGYQGEDRSPVVRIDPYLMGAGVHVLKRSALETTLPGLPLETGGLTVAATAPEDGVQAIILHEPRAGLPEEEFYPEHRRHTVRFSNGETVEGDTRYGLSPPNNVFGAGLAPPGDFSGSVEGTRLAPGSVLLAATIPVVWENIHPHHPVATTFSGQSITR